MIDSINQDVNYLSPSRNDSKFLFNSICSCFISMNLINVIIKTVKRGKQPNYFSQFEFIIIIFCHSDIPFHRWANQLYKCTMATNKDALCDEFISFLTFSFEISVDMLDYLDEILSIQQAGMIYHDASIESKAENAKSSSNSSGSGFYDISGFNFFAPIVKVLSSRDFWLPQSCSLSISGSLCNFRYFQQIMKGHHIVSKQDLTTVCNF